MVMLGGQYVLDNFVMCEGKLAQFLDVGKIRFMMWDKVLEALIGANWTFKILLVVLVSTAIFHVILLWGLLWSKAVSTTLPFNILLIIVEMSPLMISSFFKGLGDLTSKILLVFLSIFCNMLGHQIYGSSLIMFLHLS